MLDSQDEIFSTVIIITIFVLALVSIIITTAVLYYNRKKRHNSERAAFAQTLLQSQLEIKEQTLQHIARELHDNLGQVASLIKINLNTLQLSDHAKATVKIEDTKELVRQLIMDLKFLSVSLDSDRVVRMGLQKSLSIEAEKLTRIGYAVQLVQEGVLSDLNANTTVIIYRMIQEILNNIVKHSQARRVTIAVHEKEKFVNLEITDDGVGFDIDEKLIAGGSGLINLKSRAKLIAAQLTIRSSAAGTEIHIQVPL